MYRLIHLLIVISAIQSCLLAGSVALADSDTWRIGALLCLTGDCAALGDDSLKGAQLAAEELNTKGGVLGKKVILVVQDTAEGTSGAGAVTAFRQLRTDKNIRYYLGPTWTAAGLSLAPIVAKDKNVIMATPSLGAREFNTAGDNLFNLRGVDEEASRSLARFAFKQGLLRAGIFSSQQPWDSAQSVFFEDEFKKLGGQIVVKVEPLPNATDLSSEALRIVRAKPDVVFLGMLVAGRGAKELRRLGFLGLKMGPYIDDTRVQEAQGALEGAVFFTFPRSSDEFRQKYYKAYGRNPAQEVGGTAYDTIYAFSHAVEMAGTFEPGPVKAAMLKLNYTGASGPITVDSEGCVKNTPVGWKVAGTDFVPVN